MGNYHAVGEHEHFGLMFFGSNVYYAREIFCKFGKSKQQLNVNVVHLNLTEHLFSLGKLFFLKTNRYHVVVFVKIKKNANGKCKMEHIVPPHDPSR